MKILLSAYACEPNKGSEPGVGWGWAIELAKHHQVWVVTRDNNKPTITEYLIKNPNYNSENLKFIYVGLSRKLTFWKKGRRGMRLFYMLWQRKAVKVANEWHKEVCFDLVQHVTFVSYTQPTYMYKLGIPLIWGPVSGGENIPKEIKIDMSPKEKLIEHVRRFSQDTALLIPSIRNTMRFARHILVATEETKDKIPMKYHKKTKIIPAIGLERIPNIEEERKKDTKIRIIMAGRLIYWKSFDIGLKAFLLLADKYPNVELHILGEGERKKGLKKLAGKYLNNQIFFEKPVEHNQIFKFYQRFDIFLNTTLRDSGCMTLMEAMCSGVPCIAISTGGPKILLGDFEFCKINAPSYGDNVDMVAKKLETLILDARYRETLSIQQYEFSRNKFLMSNKVQEIANIYSCERTSWYE